MVLPVIKLEMMRGRISIFNILMSISPGKAINMTTSGWRGDAKRRRPPHTAPRMTPRRERGEISEFVFRLSQMNSSRDSVILTFLIPLCYQMMNNMLRKYHYISQVHCND